MVDNKLTATEANELAKKYIPLEDRLTTVFSKIRREIALGKFSTIIDPKEDTVVYNALNNYEDTIPELKKLKYEVYNDYKPNEYNPTIRIRWGTDQVYNNLLNQENKKVKINFESVNKENYTIIPPEDIGKSNSRIATAMKLI